MAFRGDLDALILGVLGTGRMHGYEISKRINEGAEDSIRVKEAQLYPILHRLENDGKIEAEWLPQEGKPARKVYRLTDTGRSALAAKQVEWQKFALSVATLLGTKPEVSHG